MSKQAATGDKTAKRLFDILSRYKAALEQGKSARTVELDKEDRKAVHDLHLLTDKPVLYVCNVDEKSANWRPTRNGRCFWRRRDSASRASAG